MADEISTPASVTQAPVARMSPASPGITLEFSPITQEMINAQVPWTHNAMDVQCPYCHELVTTNVQYKTGQCTYIAAVFCSLFCCWCCWLPFVVNDYKDACHACPACDRYLGTYKRVNLN